MTPEDRFGLQGDPEMQSARRVQFGSPVPWLAIVMLILPSFTAIMSITEPPETLGRPAYFITLLQVPALLWGWWTVLKKAHTDNEKLWGAILAYQMVLLVNTAAKIVSDYTFQRPLGTFNPVMMLFETLIVGFGMWLYFTKRLFKK